MIIRLFFLASATILMASFPLYGEELQSATNFKVAENAISVPLGYILLAKRGEEYCALKFSKSIPVSPQHEWDAKYESYYRTDSNGIFTDKKSKHQRDTLTERQPRGIGRLAMNRSDSTVFCGNISLNWSGPTWVYPYSASSERRGIKLAPTKWTEFADVNVLDERLYWYGYDESRKVFEIPVDALW